MRSALARVIAMAVLVAACNNAASSPPSTAQASPSTAQTAGAPSTSAPGQTPDPGPGGPAAPTSASKIRDALMGGAIDEPTSILYRLYAAFGDDRLPQEYQGAPSEDGAAADVARERWDTLTGDQRAGLLPFLVRPTSPRSWYAPTTSTRSGGGAQLASVRTAASCTNGFAQRQVSPTVPILIWGQCGGRSEAAVMARVQEVAEIMDGLWEPMTTYMGEPLGDQNVAGDTFADSPEGGDGITDIYVVDTSLSLHGRTISTGALASTRSWSPWVGPAGAEATSGYIVVPAIGQTGTELKSTMAHEFFHVLEYAHNNLGTIYGAANDRLWFMEASAVWSEHEFVPEARATEVYPRFEDFQATDESLTTTDGDNEYVSWPWPLFMRQELGRDAVANAWRALEGKDGYDQTMAALDGQLSFKTRFHEFAVRVWNEQLNPGNPIDPRFHALDPAFPDSQPSGARISQGNRVSATGYFEAFPKLPPLWSKYWVIEPDSDVGSLTFDFSTLFGVEVADVDLILNINGTWQRRSASLTEEEKVCDVDYAIVVISNHAYAPNAEIEGGWAVHGDGNTCNAKGSYSVTLTGPKTGQGTHTGTADIYCTENVYNNHSYWDAIMVLPNAPFGSLTDFNAGENVSGWFTVMATAGGMELGLWFARSDQPNHTASVVVSGSPGTNAHIVADGSWREEPDKLFTIHIVADCSETYYSSP